MIALRDNPMALGSLCVAGATLVAMTTLSRLVNSFSALPTISSLPPFEYMLAVSKKLIPASIAWRISERLASSLETTTKQGLRPASLPVSFFFHVGTFRLPWRHKPSGIETDERLVSSMNINLQ